MSSAFPQTDPASLPDFYTDFVNENHMKAFEKALSTKDDDESSDAPDVEYISSRNDWIPVFEPVKNDTKGKTGEDAGKDAAIFSASASASASGISSGLASKRHKNRPKSPRSAHPTRPSAAREGLSYRIFRWPLLILLLLYLLGLILLYAIVRLYVAIYENTITWRGERQKLRHQMHVAQTYPDWVSAATKLDKLLGLDEWRSDPRFFYYDYHTIGRLVRHIRVAREAGNVAELCRILQGCIRENFAGIESGKMYSHCYFGTKLLVAEYYNEVAEALDIVAQSNKISVAEKVNLLRHMRRNYGKTALCLSGGACFAYYHFGILKALNDNGVLPRIISGTSGGALVAALAATRSDTELGKLLVPELAYKITAVWEPFPNWVIRWWRTGARFDAVDWARRSVWWTRGSLTFREAYEKTGKILNVSTVPADPHSPVILCNHVTSPDCVIWSALLASAAVPGILNPVVLMTKANSEAEGRGVCGVISESSEAEGRGVCGVMKENVNCGSDGAANTEKGNCGSGGAASTGKGNCGTNTKTNIKNGSDLSQNSQLGNCGADPSFDNSTINAIGSTNTNSATEITPFSFGSKWKDGSLRTDIPLEALHAQFNVRFSIVSQVNPHISLFFYAPRGSVGRPVTHRNGRGWRGGFLGSAAEHLLKLEIRKWLSFVKSLDLLPRFKDSDWSSIWLQRFSGTITLWPKIRLRDFWYILSDPTPQRMSEMLKAGQLAAFPKIHFISNRLRIERKLEKLYKEAKAELRIQRGTNRFREAQFNHKDCTDESDDEESETLLGTDPMDTGLWQAHDGEAELSFGSSGDEAADPLFQFFVKSD